MTLRRRALWALLVAKLVGAWGIGWDIRWHLMIGRDSFWIAPHAMTYASVIAGALIPLGVLAVETWRRRWGADRLRAATTVGRRGTRGFHLAWWGMIITILAAPIDDLWHRLFGLDVTIWSPPHLLLFAGFQVAHLGGLLIALEVYDAGWKRWVALIANGVFLLWTFQIVVDQSVQTAFRRGSIFLFTFPVLGALAFTFALVLVGRIAESRSAPLALAVGALMLAISILLVGDVGFALLEPTSVIDEVIAADPTSPTAVAHEMARRNGWVLGRSMLLRQILLAPAALMMLAPVRRVAAHRLGLRPGPFRHLVGGFRTSTGVQPHIADRNRNGVRRGRRAPVRARHRMVRDEARRCVRARNASPRGCPESCRAAMTRDARLQTRAR